MKQKLYISELLPETELASVIDNYHTGLELIHFSISENLDHYKQSLQQAKAMLSRLNHPHINIHGPFLDLNPMSYDSRIRQVTMNRFAQAYEAALELDADKIIYHSGMIPSVYYLDGWAERVTEFFSEFLENRTELTVCMENVLDQEILPVRDVAMMIQAHNFGLCLDIGHAHCYSVHPVTEWATTLAPYIRHVHFHNNDGFKDQHLGPTHGNLPWKEVLQIFEQTSMNPEISYTIECAEKKAVEEWLTEFTQK